MAYYICNEKWDRSFSVPHCVVQDHLDDCDAVKLKVLLLVLHEPSSAIEADKLAEKLGQTAADIRDALNFWVRKGLLQTEMPNVPQTEAAIPVAENKAKPLSKPTPARMTANEIHEMTQRQPLIRSLLHETEAILGKTLTSTDISTVISLYDWAGIPADVILMVVAHCASLDKRNLRYIEKTAMNWQELGLDTADKVENYLNEQTLVRQREKEVQSAFGIYDRKLTGKEKESIAKWYEEFGFGIDMIRLAYEKTVDNTGKVSFPYIAKILSNWNEKGIRTPAQALAETNPVIKAQDAEKKEYSFDLESFEQQHRWNVPDAE